ncbi:MAG: phosphatidate cytidylyltransferase [bacterium]
MLKKNSLIGRILIGTGLAFAVTCIILYTTREILTILVIIWILGATIEFIKILRTAEINLSLGLLILLNLSAALTAYFQLLPEFLIVPIGVIFFSSIAQRHRLPRIPVYGLFTFIYLGFLPSHLILLSSLVAEKHLSPWITMFPLILTWTNDTAAYAIGRLIGKRQLAPALSPNKTVEGFIAGTAFSALLSWFWLPKIITFSDQPSWLWALSGAVLGIIAQAGDLFESLFKRAAGIKDSSNILGAHGGFLDRMDSLLFTIPAFYYLLRLFSP